MGNILAQRGAALAISRTFFVYIFDAYQNVAKGLGVLSSVSQTFEGAQFTSHAPLS